VGEVDGEIDGVADGSAGAARDAGAGGGRMEGSDGTGGGGIAGGTALRARRGFRGRRWEVGGRRFPYERVSGRDRSRIGVRLCGIGELD
jgi:hypothetical protein